MSSKQRHINTQGFTLIELMIAMAVIGLLATIVAAKTDLALQRAKAVKAAAQVQLLQKTVRQYYSDTGRYMITRCDSDCTEANDPFLNKLGVAGWNGPYAAVYSLKHPWNGHIAAVADQDIDSDGELDCLIYLDDDRPQTSEFDNSGQVPTAALIVIDKIVDDGDLTTGIAIGDGFGLWSVQGELVIRCQV